MITITTSDAKRFVDCGSSDLWALYSTASVLLKKNNSDLRLALNFLKAGKSTPVSSLETARQLNLIRDRLSAFPPQQAVFDVNDLHKKAPWADNISPAVTSCANLFLTADGKDLFFELVSLLCYAAAKDVSVSIEE